MVQTQLSDWLRLRLPVCMTQCAQYKSCCGPEDRALKKSLDVTQNSMYAETLTHLDRQTYPCDCRPSSSHTARPQHERSQSAGQALVQQQMVVTSRSASYQPSASSPFDHATGGLFASEDIEQLYSLPEGAQAGRLRRTDDLEVSQDGSQQLAALVANRSGHSSPLYLSCSSGSDAHDSNDAATTAALHQGPEASMGVAGAITFSSGLAQSMQRNSSEMVFWVPELGNQSQSFTEYTKNQMQQTGHASPVQLAVASASSPPPHAASSAQQSTPQSPAAHAWTAPLPEAAKAAAGSFSSTWGDSFPDDGGPHPPLAPSPHAGWAHATTGFRGGVRDDPRLRRFREADAAGSTASLSEHASGMHVGANTSGQSQSGQSQSAPMVADHHSTQDQNMQIGEAGLVFESMDMDHDLMLSEGSQHQVIGGGGAEGSDHEEKQYLRAPPSLAWEAPPVQTHTSSVANAGWANYCSDSDEA